MNVLVTGVTSPLGLAVCRRLRKIGAKITGTVRKDTDLRQKQLVDELVLLDLSDTTHFKNIRGDLDAVIHVAALSEGTPSELMSATGLSAFHLLDRVRELQIPTVVHVSSMAVYGNTKVDSVSSVTPISHSDPYGAAKWVAECCFASGPPDTKCVSVRSPAIVGGRSHRHFLARLMASMMYGAPEIRVSNPHFCFNNIVHENTLAEFLVTLAITPPPLFTAVPVGSSESMPLSEIVDVLVTATKYKGRVSWFDSAVTPFSINSDEAMSLGFKPLTTRETVTRWLNDLFSTT